MKFFSKYKYPLTATLGLIAIFCIFQNGTCNNNGSYSAGQNSGSGGGGGGGSSAFTVSPLTATVAPGGTVRVAGVGGLAPYTYEVSFGGGTISSSGVYTAPSSPATVGITVKDASGSPAYANINVAVPAPSALALSAAATTVNTGNTVQLTASGGTGSYIFSVVSGGGSVNTSGLYTAPATTGTAIVKVTDGSQTAQVSITIQVGPAAFVWADSNSVMNPFDTWRPLNLLDTSESTCYSSLGGNTFAPNPKPYIRLIIGPLTNNNNYPINRLRLTARRINGRVYAFPSSYNIKIKSTDGQSWVSAGNFSTQPDFDGIARIDLPQTYYTKEVVIEADSLTKDNTFYYYFQLCGITQ